MQIPVLVFELFTQMWSVQIRVCWKTSKQFVDWCRAEKKPNSLKHYKKFGYTFLLIISSSLHKKIGLL